MRVVVRAHAHTDLDTELLCQVERLVGGRSHHIVLSLLCISAEPAVVAGHERLQTEKRQQILFRT